MPPVLHLLLLVFALVFFGISAWLSGPGFTWQRAISLGLTALVASMLVW